MKPLLAPTFLLVLSGVPGEGASLAFEPEEDTTLERTFEARAEYERTDLELTVDGEPYEPPAEIPGYSEHFLERISVSDRLEQVGEGRPLELVRTFDELLQETTFSAGEEKLETTAGSALEGRSVRFTWDEEEERYSVESADEDDLDDEVREWLLEDLDLLALLPDEEVEPGDEWEVAPELYLAFMWPSGLLDFREEGQDEADTGREFSQQTIEKLAGKGQARFEELREEEGLRLAVIHVELEITTGSESTREAESGELQLSIEIERTIEGTVLWDLEHGHAHSAELEAEASRQTTRTGTTQDPEGNEVELEQSELFEGTIRYTMTVARE